MQFGRYTKPCYVMPTPHDLLILTCPSAFSYHFIEDPQLQSLVSTHLILHQAGLGVTLFSYLNCFLGLLM